MSFCSIWFCLVTSNVIPHDYVMTVLKSVYIHNLIAELGGIQT